MTSSGDQAGTNRAGILYGVAAYGLWGVFPAYFLALHAGPIEILGHRILWSLAVCLGIVAIQRRWGALGAVFRHRRQLAAAAAAASLISINWLTYLIAVTTGRITEAALGYFLNPLVSIALGLVLLGERLRPPQALAAAVGLLGGGYLAVAARTPSWIAATLACSFGLYGLVKKRLAVGAVVGLTVETAVLVPAAVVVLWWAPDGSTFASRGSTHAALLIGMGVVTAIPLLLFAAAARRVPLVVVGLLQFIAPVLQFLFGLFRGEPMSLHRWIGFAIVWLALGILILDMLRGSGVLRARGPAG
ncbi:MAG: EamA family transporter RarD [Austwickia sp.]|nr:EamA family transporter RarD [Austwickia sp.]MBK8436111.1 EamA family transporter RarD [Austwickia sp.]MBK9101791.1 EamA family transporter RarD [Austwickia sp.]